MKVYHCHTIACLIYSFCINSKLKFLMKNQTSDYCVFTEKCNFFYQNLLSNMQSNENGICTVTPHLNP